MVDPRCSGSVRRSSSLTDMASTPSDLAPVRRRRTPSAGTLSSAPTEERLHEHAQRTSRSSTSPYYRGLTDSGLYLQSLVGGSPGRESVVSRGSTRSFSSTFLVRIHQWGASCFTQKRNDGEAAGASKKTPPSPDRESWDPGLMGSSSAARRVGKSLRESELAPAQPAPATVTALQAAAAIVEADDEWSAAAAAVEGGGSEEREYVWGDKYRPSTLREFICNRERAEELRQLKPATVTAVQAVAAIVEAGDEWSAAAAPAEGGCLEEREYVWGDKYRPSTLREFICNRELAEELRQLANKQHCSHFIFEGPPGVGKRTMILAFLREIFGPLKLKTKNILKKIELKGEHVTNIDVNVKISSQHVEVNLSEVSAYEKYIIAALLNESHAPLDKPDNCDRTNCRAIVLYEAEKLSTDSQHYVRWLLEKYKGCNRIFFCCFDASKLQHIKHLCKIIKLQPPSESEVTEVLEFIAMKEHIELPHCLARQIAENSMHNLRQAIRSFEASWKSNFSFKENQKILTGWEEDIAAIARNIIEEQSPKQLYMIRNKLKNLIEHDVSPDFIFETLIVELKKNLDDHLQSKTKIDALYQEYSIVSPKDNGFLSDIDQYPIVSSKKQTESDKRLHDPRKNVHHFMRIEEFTAKFMSCYKSNVTKNIGGENRFQAF